MTEGGRNSLQYNMKNITMLNPKSQKSAAAGMSRNVLAIFKYG